MAALPPVPAEPKRMPPVGEALLISPALKVITEPSDVVVPPRVEALAKMMAKVPVPVARRMPPSTVICVTVESVFKLPTIIEAAVETTPPA